LVKPTSYEAPYYAVFSSPFLPLRSKFSSQHPLLKAPSIYVLNLV